MRRRPAFAVFATISALGLVLTACGGGSSSKTGSKPAGTSTVPNVTPATQIISDTVPAGATRIHLEAGPIHIKPGQNDISFKRTIPQPKEDGWIVGMQTNLRLKDGSVPPVDVIHLHHGVWLNLSAPDATSPMLPERFMAAGEEKTRMILPAGYGYQYKTTDHWLLNYMLHNQLSKPDEVWVTYDIDLIPATSPQAKGIKKAIPIWMDVQNGSAYPVFDVLHGSGTNGTYTYPDQAPGAYAGGPPKNEFTLPFSGTLLTTAGHLHPGGLHNDLWVTRAGATAPHAKPGSSDTAHLFSSVAHYFEPAGPVSWDVSMSATPDSWRVAVKKGDTLSTSVTYDTTRASWYESMGIMIVWMAPNDTTGTDPFKTPVDVPGVLTHGHLNENNNHGGQPAPDDYVDMTKLPSKVMPSGSTLAIADFAYQGDMSAAESVPAVVQGGALVFRNDDSAQRIPHTITSCTAPCDLSTGIAYPLANGQPRFDSGDLAIGVNPSSGKITWSTPTNLPPGTYTYYCRIHPFMRGAFRVLPKN
jgi:plastocyanin